MWTPGFAAGGSLLRPMCPQIVFGGSQLQGVAQPGFVNWNGVPGHFGMDDSLNAIGTSMKIREMKATQRQMQTCCNEDAPMSKFSEEA